MMFNASSPFTLIRAAAYLTWGCSVSAASAPSSTLLSRASWPWGPPGRSCSCARKNKPCAPSSWWPSRCPATGAWLTTNWPRASWISSAPTWSNHGEWSWPEKNSRTKAALRFGLPGNHPGFLIDDGMWKTGPARTLLSDFLLWAVSNTLYHFCAAGEVVKLFPERLCLNSVKIAYFLLSRIFTSALLRLLLLQKLQSLTTNLKY